MVRSAHQASSTAQSILHLLQSVQEQRSQRQRVKGLSEAVDSIKAYQQQRFSHTYADLLASARYGAAARFFLEELYGPVDFSERDHQFARVIPTLVKLFPQDIVNTVHHLAELHALSESLDTAMGEAHGPGQVDARSYARAWQSTGRAADREIQVALTVQLGSALDRLTRKPLLRHTLRMMRGPAGMAGLQQLQALLEAGFDSFGAMGGAGEFISTVAQRESALASLLFSVSIPARKDGPTLDGADASFVDGRLP